MSPTHVPHSDAPRSDAARRRHEPGAPQHGRSTRPAAGPDSSAVGLEQAEAAIVEHYRRLVRLGYLVLPPSLGRHRRVITAHALAQRALPRTKAPAEAVPLPQQRGAGGAVTDPGYCYVRQRVLRAALDAGRPVRIAGRELPWLPRRPQLFPRILGLRVFPHSSGAGEPALEQALSEVSATTRAAYVLGRLEGLPPEAVRALLTTAGVTEAQARAAVTAAGSVHPAEQPPGAGDGPGGPPPGAGALPALDDPCTLQARPTDLLRRRQYVKAAAAVGGALLLGAGLLALLPGEDTSAFAHNEAAREALNPDLLVRAGPDDWRRSARLDFTAWPARGPAVEDTELLRRALSAWAGPNRSVRVSVTPGTPTGPAAGPPHLLYAGEVAGASLVVFHDGLRLVRYGEPAQGGGGAVLDFARTDGADATTTAVVLNRGPQGARYLLAPWVTDARVHDLLDPEREPVPLPVDRDGVTVEAPNSLGHAECTSYPVVEFSGTGTGTGTGAGSGGDGKTVQADLGELVPAVLTDGAPHTAPGHPLDGAAAQRWARTACHLPSVSTAGVRTVNLWEFARQRLPAGAGTAHWVCTRAETWQGRGTSAMVQFQGPPTPGGGPHEPGAVAARSEDGIACGERAEGVLSGAMWRAPEGEWYLLAAGSEQVSAITATGDVSGRGDGRTLVLPAPEGSKPEVSAELSGGGTLQALK